MLHSVSQRVGIFTYLTTTNLIEHIYACYAHRNLAVIVAKKSCTVVYSMLTENLSQKVPSGKLCRIPHLSFPDLSQKAQL